MPGQPLVRSLLAVGLASLLIARSPAQQADAIAPAPPSQASESTIFSGRVVRSWNGQPLAGATVRCQRPVRIMGCATNWEAEVPSRIERVVTDADGRFRFEFPEGLDLHSIVVMPTAETGLGYALVPDANFEWRQWFQAGEHVEAEVVVPPSCSLRGIVLNECGGGVAGARVLAWMAGAPLDLAGQRLGPDEIVTTDALGAFLLPSTSSSVLLEVEKDGCVAADRLSIRTDAGAHLHGLTLTVHEARFLEGVITDAAGAPCADAIVGTMRGKPHDDGAATDIPGVFRHTNSWYSLRADAEGRFRVGPLPHDECTLTVSLAPFLPWTRTVVPDGQRLQIVLDAGARLSGVVRNQAGVPIAGATLETMAYAGRQVVTDSAGRYRFTGVPTSDNAILSVWADGYALRVVEGVDTSAQGDHSCDIELEPAAALAGRILGSDGKPLTFGTVEIHGDRMVQSVVARSLLWRRHGYEHPAWEEYVRRSSTQTAANGSFRFDGLYPGAYLLRTGSPPQVFSVTSGTRPIELRLTAPDELRRRLVGFVFDPRSKEPIENYTIEPQYSVSGPPGPDPLQQDGAHFVLDLRDYHTRVIVAAPGRAFWVSSFDGTDARDFAMDVPLFPARRLVVRTLDDHGHPLPGMSVSFHQGGDPLIFEIDGHRAWGSGWTGTDGTLAAERLPAAALTVTVSRPNATQSRVEAWSEAKVDLSGDDGTMSVDIVVPELK